MKILLLGEYSGLNNELKSALVAAGHEVTLAGSNDFFKKYPADINLGRGSNIYTYKISQLILPFLNLNKFVGYDVVHVINFYIFPRVPFFNLFLIRFLKNNNALVTLSGAGDDPFFIKYAESTMRYNPIPSHEKYDRRGKQYYMRSESHLKTMREYMNYVDGVIPIMYEYYSTFCAAGYASKTSLPVAIPINLEKIPEKSNCLKNNKVVFFHGLNRYGFKGTYLIEEAFINISSKYPRDVECVIAGNMPFDSYMKLVDRVNVSVDQVFSYSLSMNPLYSMARNKFVCGGAEQESSILYDGVLPPVANIQPDINQIFNVFENIIENKHLISDRSEEGRAFVSKYHNPDLVAFKYIEYWNSLS